MLQIAVTGKPNVGKSSFFNSATSSSVEMAIHLLLLMLIKQLLMLLVNVLVKN